jgi:hypothetical protein
MHRDNFFVDLLKRNSAWRPILPKVTNIALQIYVITNIYNLHHLHIYNYLPIFSGRTSFYYHFESIVLKDNVH